MSSADPSKPSSPPVGDAGGAPDDDATRLVRPGEADFETGAFVVRDARAHDPADDLTRVAPRAADIDDLTRVAPRGVPPCGDDGPHDDLTRVATGIRRASAAESPGTANTFATLAPIQSDPDTMAARLSNDDAAAKQVGRYLVLEKLGRGGMATVFKAHDPDIGRDVAIKFLHSTLCEDEEYRGRFLREARAAGGLSHPNIVTVYDVGEIEGRPFLAMELLPGKSLADAMEGGKKLPVRDVVVIGMQLARALDYAHTRRIVHRDIKPGNIALLEGNTVKVMDFGIAHMELGSGAEQHTRVGDVLGTPQYMSPEQTRGERLDGRSDLFSVGIILYQMLTGQRPFQGGSMVAVAMKIAQEQPPGLDKLRPDVPAPLRRIVERCLAKAPDQRFQTGRELSDALARVLGHIDEEQRQRETPRIVPLRVKWAATMGLIVAIVMSIVATIVVQRQYAALVAQVSDDGAALARFFAAQEAKEVLDDNWDVVAPRVQALMESGDFKSFVVVDRAGIVRASGVEAEVDQRYSPPPAGGGERRTNGVVVTRLDVGGERVLSFDAPITFKSGGREVVQGHVVIGLREAPLLRVAQLSLILMAVLVVVTVIAVAVAMYFVANWFARPVKTISEGMDEIARGHFDHRIGEVRRDEFGLLFAAFDRMAAALQATHAGTLVTHGPIAASVQTGAIDPASIEPEPSPADGPRVVAESDESPGSSH